MTGNIYDRTVKFDADIAKSVEQGFIDSIKDEKPEAPHKLIQEMKGRGKLKVPTGRYKAGFPCSYCNYLRHCKGEYTTEYKNAQGGTKAPTFIFNKGEKDECY